jgi:hypothetical protein
VAGVWDMIGALVGGGTNEVMRGVSVREGMRIVNTGQRAYWHTAS